MSRKWDERFMRQAIEVGSWSKDPRMKVGCCIVGDGYRQISGGFNGFPRGVADDSRLDDQDVKVKLIVHAEANAVVAAARTILAGYTVYTSRFPCGQCAALLIQAGISRIVYQNIPDESSRWYGELPFTGQMLREAGVLCERLIP